MFSDVQLVTRDNEQRKSAVLVHANKPMSFSLFPAMRLRTLGSGISNSRPAWLAAAALPLR